MSGDDPSGPLARLWVEVEAELERRHPRSAAHHARHAAVLLDHTSHAVRWARPFMPVTTRAHGAYVDDLDGHRAIDYWQGHFANLFGHNPAFLRAALTEALADGRGLQSGMVHEVEAEVAALVCAATGAETVRFTTAGTLGTFYATVLARAFTGRDKVIKMSGGWHGSQPYGLKGVSVPRALAQAMESEGLSSSTPAEIVLARFNDVAGLERLFAEHGDDVACVLFEPVLGAAGGLVGTRAYLRAVRDLCDRHGALMLADEIITGFRFRAGDACALYDVVPDLWILGKVIGGGMPVAAVAGRRDVLSLASRAVDRVRFEGGTYSAHELSLVAARAVLVHLRDHASTVYPERFRLAERARALVAAAGRDAGVPLTIAGHDPEVLPGSDLVLVHPTREPLDRVLAPEDLHAARIPGVDHTLLKSMLLLHDVSTRNGLGMVSAAHTEADLEHSADALAAVLRRLTEAGLA